MTRFQTRVAIIGGGISGLAAAYQLQSDDALFDDGCEVHLFEAGETPGGVLQTEEVEGFRLEIGPDSMLSRLPEGIELCREIGLADDLIGTNPDQRGVYVVCRGRLRRVPDGLALMAPQRIWPFVTTPILSLGGKLRLAAERFVPRRTTEEDESLADFVRRRLGRETFERLVQPLAGGIYMGDPEQLSVRATFPQFVDMESKHGSLTRGTRAVTPRPAASDRAGGPSYSMFVAPRRGMQQLADRLVERLDPSRVKVHCRSQIEGLNREPSASWSATVVDTTLNTRRRESFQGVIVAAPAYRAAAMLADADPRLSSLLDEIPYAGCVVVNLAFERDAIAHPLDSFGFIVPHIENRAVLACTFSSVKYAERAPQGRALLRLFLGGGCRPEVLHWSDDRVIQEARAELRELLDIERPPLFWRINRWHRSMPQYHLGHVARVAQIEAAVTTHPRLELAGNAYQGVGIPHCIRSGRQASERLSAVLKQDRQPHG